MKSLTSRQIQLMHLHSKGFEGVTGTITIDENGNVVKPAVIKIIEKGEFKFVTVVNP